MEHLKHLNIHIFRYPSVEQTKTKPRKENLYALEKNATLTTGKTWTGVVRVNLTSNSVHTFKDASKTSALHISSFGHNFILKYKKLEHFPCTIKYETSPLVHLVIASAST